MSALDHLGEFIARGLGDNQPDHVRRLAASHLLDTVGAWIAGTTTQEAKSLIAFHAQSRARSGQDAGLLDDVALHCALARLSEVDDIHLGSTTTPGSVVIPAAFVLGAASKADGASLCSAILAGYEAMIRFGMAIDGSTNIYRGIWTTYIAAPVGVAAVAARLLGLNASQAAHALALAVTMAAPGVGHHNAATTTRWLALGHAARSGAAAAFAAQAGFTSDAAILDGGFFPNVYRITPDPKPLTHGLGEGLALEGVSFKPWCAARQTMAATQALKELLADGLDAAAIVAVEAFVLPTQQKMIDHGVVAGDRASHLTSLQYQLALAAVAPDDQFDLAQSPATLDPAVRAFMDKISVAPDESLLAHYPDAWPARIAVGTKAGTRQREIMHVPGDPARALSDDDVKAKFLRLVTPIADGIETDALLQASLDIFDKGSPARLFTDVAVLCGVG